ncbi:MAG: hypothetical protein KBA55_12570 [Ruminococcus sp.]|nr:hypothetical protein [Ruminococcus sp.]
MELIRQEAVLCRVKLRNLNNKTSSPTSAIVRTGAEMKEIGKEKAYDELVFTCCNGTG